MYLDSAKPGLSSFMFEGVDKNIVCFSLRKADHLKPKPAINLFQVLGYWLDEQTII